MTWYTIIQRETSNTPFGVYFFFSNLLQRNHIAVTKVLELAHLAFIIEKRRNLCSLQNIFTDATYVICFSSVTIVLVWHSLTKLKQWETFQNTLFDFVHSVVLRKNWELVDKLVGMNPMTNVLIQDIPLVKQLTTHCNQLIHLKPIKMNKSSYLRLPGNTGHNCKKNDLVHNHSTTIIEWCIELLFHFSKQYKRKKPHQSQKSFGFC